MYVQMLDRNDVLVYRHLARYLESRDFLYSRKLSLLSEVRAGWGFPLYERRIKRTFSLSGLLLDWSRWLYDVFQEECMQDLVRSGMKTNVLLLIYRSARMSGYSWGYFPYRINLDQSKKHFDRSATVLRNSKASCFPLATMVGALDWAKSIEVELV